MADKMFELNMSGLFSGMDELKKKLEQSCLAYGSTAATQLEGYAKAHRPWTDRTARARQGLKGTAERVQDGVQISLAHTVDYGLWLELAMQKRYAILEPTIRINGPNVVKGMTNMLEREMKGYGIDASIGGEII